MALLRHTLADGTFHYDWMIQTAPASDLLTFRCGVRIDEAATDSFEAERLPDHRQRYLAYEGPLSGGRGEVERVASGRASVTPLAGGAMRIRSAWRGGGGGGVWEGRPASEGGARWLFRRVEQAPGQG